MEMDLHTKQDQEYIKQLGLDGLFHMEESIRQVFFTSILWINPSGVSSKAIRGELQIVRRDNEIRLFLSHLGNFDWKVIEGSLAERRQQILTYLVGIGYVPAIALLRVHKIDALV